MSDENSVKKNIVDSINKTIIDNTNKITIGILIHTNVMTVNKIANGNNTLFRKIAYQQKS
jgi:hypothetical protein